VGACEKHRSLSLNNLRIEKAGLELSLGQNNQDGWEEFPSENEIKTVVSPLPTKQETHK
jgi:hypothetical protein